eukprot:IDg2776t1
MEERRLGESSRGKRVLWSEDGSITVLLTGLQQKETIGTMSVGKAIMERQRKSFHSDIKKLIENTMDIANTGAGVVKTCQIRDYILRKWSNYYEMEPVMLDRPDTCPLFSNEALNIESEHNDARACASGSKYNTGNVLGRKQSEFDTAMSLDQSSNLIPVSEKRKRLSISEIADSETESSRKSKLRKSNLRSSSRYFDAKNEPEIRQEEVSLKREELIKRRKLMGL